MAEFEVGQRVKCIKKCNKDVTEPVLNELYVISKVHATGEVELYGVYEEDCHWAADQFELVPDEPTALDVQVGGSHYKDYAIQPAEFCIANNIPWAEGSVIKYVVRHKSKNGKEDLIKAKHLLDILIEELYPE